MVSRWVVVGALALVAGCSGGGGGGSKPDPLAPQGLTYDEAAPEWVKGVETVPDTPHTTGGDAPTAYTVAPPLPAGMTLDATTGVISGTPSEVTSLGTYVVTATNPHGAATVDLRLSVTEPEVHSVSGTFHSDGSGHDQNERVELSPTLWGQADKDGKFVIQGVPSGWWTVTPNMAGTGDKVTPKSKRILVAHSDVTSVDFEVGLYSYPVSLSRFKVLEAAVSGGQVSGTFAMTIVNWTQDTVTGGFTWFATMVAQNTYRSYRSLVLDPLQCGGAADELRPGVCETVVGFHSSVEDAGGPLNPGDTVDLTVEGYQNNGGFGGVKEILTLQ